MKLSIIIAMYNTREYIQQCIESLVSFCNKFNVEYEILLGIDGNQKDLEFILNNYFEDNIEIYYNEKNEGPFVMYNYLIDCCKYDKIFFFNSDDYLNAKYYDELYNAMLVNDYVRIGFHNIIKNKYNRILFIAQGVFMINKNVFANYGYFENWFCAADTEFKARLKHYNVKCYVLKQPTFIRRVHPKSLTQCVEYGIKSNIRKNYKSILKNKIITNEWTFPMKLRSNIKKYDKRIKENRD